VQRALELLRNAAPVVGDGTGKFDTAIASRWHEPIVPRGTLQATFVYKGFDDLRRMGLPVDVEKRLRDTQVSSNGTGALAVEDTVPGGPCENAGVQVGDVLVAITVDGTAASVTNFVQLERVLDDNVGKEITITLQRAGASVDLAVTPDDLHEITPSKFLEINGGTTLGLSQSRNTVYCPWSSALLEHLPALATATYITSALFGPITARLFAHTHYEVHLHSRLNTDTFLSRKASCTRFRTSKRGTSKCGAGRSTSPSPGTCLV
jgi:hypothetical protein